jgi:hypothetical protein
MISTTPWSYVMAPPAPVWTGGITDTLHLGSNGILERQAAQLADYRRIPEADTSVNVCVYLRQCSSHACMSSYRFELYVLASLRSLRSTDSVCS